MPPTDSRRGSLRVPQKLSASRHGMVSSQHHLATQAGASMLARGGNAVDAAVATALALGVCEPAASGLGGQTFLIVHLASKRKTLIVDGSSFAPHRTIPGTLTSEDLRRGYRASTVPTTPRTLAYVLERYGQLSWREVLEPAIHLAEDGFPVSQLLHDLTRRELKWLKQGTAAPFFLKDGRRAYRVGEILRQPVLATTLRRLADKGVDDFYHGYIARTIERDMIRHGGLIRRDDLAQVHPPIERRPLAAWFGSQRVMTMPPPGAGRTLLEMLNVMNQLPRRYRRLHRPESVLMLARIMQQALRDRRDRPYDPEYYAQVSDRKMLSAEYARRLARNMRTRGETTHLSIMDKYGNAVGLTQSIERVYGSCCASEKLGFLYNNYMSAYDMEDMSHPYYLRPVGVPWASVAPTIVFRGRRPWLVIGSPGSERISTSIFQVILRLETNTPLNAVDAPRLYCDLHGRVSLEAPRMRDDIPDLLERHGFTVDAREPYAFYLGCIQMVLRDGDDLIGVADPRRDGSAAGPPS